MSDDRTTRLFRYGADMDPTAVLTAHPGARFVARAWVPIAATALPPLPDTEPLQALTGAAVGPSDAVWGVLLLLPPGSGQGHGGHPAAVETVTDDGRRVLAVVATEAADLGDRAAVLAAARYWELPPVYVRRLAAWAGDGG